MVKLPNLIEMNSIEMDKLKSGCVCLPFSARQSPITVMPLVEMTSALNGKNHKNHRLQ